MDPTTTLAGIKLLGKLLSLGLSSYHAAQGHGAELEKDLKAIQDLLASGEQAASLLPRQAPPRAQARLVALVTSAFGESWRLHFGPRFGLEGSRQLTRHFEAAVRWALLTPTATTGPAGQLEGLAELVRAPEQTAYFRALWQAFCLRRLPDLEVQYERPLIEPASGEDRRRFEATFRRACTEALAVPGMRELRDTLIELAGERTQLVRHLLLSDLATWGERHVFGNISHHAALPLMPLDGMYVEPRATLRGRRDDPARPVLQRLAELLGTHHIVVVTADFGHGKSLTSRRLARDLARSCLEDPARQAAELELPVFIKCLDALTSDAFELRRMVQRAQWAQLQALSVSLTDSDPALEPPPAGQKTLFLIDGLDEVAFIERGIVRLFDHLRGQVVGRHRAIIFSRPYVLPSELEQWGIPVLELAPFDASGLGGGQVGDWLARWNHHSQRPPVELAEVQARGLLELAQTPILLFMIAYTWGEVDLGAPAESRAQREDGSALPRWQLQEAQTIAQWRQRDRLYEAFFRAIAWGKHRFDKDRHPQVVQAAGRIRERLTDSGRLAGPAFTQGRTPGEDGSRPEGEPQVEAMLWLMARVAWEGLCLEQQGEPLTLRHVENLLADELGIKEGSTQKLVCDGLLLALQADLAHGSQRILYGHKSFREFLVARCWESHLSCLVGAEDSVGGRRALSPLMVLQRGRLLSRENNNFLFLRARLAAWPRRARLSLHRFAERCFNDETIAPAPNSVQSVSPSLRSDCRLYLREAALAIGSAIVEAGGVQAEDPWTLRSLLAGFWARGQSVVIWAPGLQSEGARLSEADLTRAELAGANLRGAHLREARLVSADLTEATLSEAKLLLANLGGATLVRAELRTAELQLAVLARCDLQGALVGQTLLAVQSLRGAVLDESQLAYLASFGDDVKGILAQIRDTDPIQSDSAAAPV